ncbi:inner membrane-spanning protein YciB [Acidimangrovimonas sediminis]|uniref:inner membrane-spanning protein YciB n=1 Tax=Acidimangrovimonas sediminis TaxID=2056283 RepID=UPI000C7FF35D|nr:inner membrane-spanning protein YciB [Acidimangrovimonas sediminis]
MAGRKINPYLKGVLEFGPIIAFFVAYMRLKGQHVAIGGTDYDGFILVTAGFVPLLVICTGLLWWLTGHLSKMQIATVVLVVIFGGLSVWLNDPSFIKMKPTIIYLLFGGILGVGLLQGKSYLRIVMEEVVPMKHEGWMILTRRVCAFFFVLAIANEIVWRTMSDEAWVWFKTFVLTVALFAFFMLQARLFRDYAIEEDAEKGEKGANR